MAARSNPGTATSATTSAARTRPAACASGTVSAGRGAIRRSSRAMTSARSRKPRIRGSKKSGDSLMMVRPAGGNPGRMIAGVGRGRQGKGAVMLRVGGVVLCGGQSSRMGRPKAWLPIGGETMLGRVVRLLGEVVSPLVVVAAPGQELPPLPPGVTVVRDPERGRGPLQGLAAGLPALGGTVES